VVSSARRYAMPLSYGKVCRIMSEKYKGEGYDRGLGELTPQLVKNSEAICATTSA
jgi:hypothetical protein